MYAVQKDRHQNRARNLLFSADEFNYLFDSENSHTKMLPLQICTKCAEKEYIKELEEDAAFDKMCDEMNI